LIEKNKTCSPLQNLSYIHTTAARVNGRGIDRDDVSTWTRSSKYIGGGRTTETSKGVELQVVIGVKAEVGMWEGR
jgi:hypothetical protein